MEVQAVNTLEDAEPGEISFLANPKYEKLVQTTRATAVVVPTDGPLAPTTTIRTKEPYAAITEIIVQIHGKREHPRFGPGDKASIAPTAEIGEGANIGPYVTLADGVTLGKRVTLYPGCYVAAHCRLGDDVVLFPSVVLYENTVLGNRVTIHANTVVGEDGLGYAPVGRKWTKIPQVGYVEIGDDVEIGAGCAIDRATLGKTAIGAGTKFSNLITIGHGTRIGEDCMLVAQVGVAGSVTVGRHVTMAGQAGVVGHIKIGEDAQIGAQAGVTNDVPEGQAVLGSPAVPIANARRQMVVMPQMPELRKRVKALERELARLTDLMEPCPRDSDCSPAPDAFRSSWPRARGGPASKWLSWVCEAWLRPSCRAWPTSFTGRAWLGSAAGFVFFVVRR